MTFPPVPCALVVDDDVLILVDACDILAAAGFRFYEASTGDAAKHMLDDRAEEVTLLFSDVELHGRTDGFALARYVAEHWPWIEIVIASGNVKPWAGDMPEKATFIGKPFNGRMIHEHLRGKLPEERQPERLRRAGERRTREEARSVSSGPSLPRFRRVRRRHPDRHDPACCSAAGAPG